MMDEEQQVDLLSAARKVWMRFWSLADRGDPDFVALENALESAYSTHIGHIVLMRELGKRNGNESAESMKSTDGEIL